MTSIDDAWWSRFCEGRLQGLHNGRIPPGPERGIAWHDMPNQLDEEPRNSERFAYAAGLLAGFGEAMASQGH